MAHDWLILADDLTGAADSAIPFACRGMKTVVGWGGQPFPPAPCNYAHDCRSRGLPPSYTAARIRYVMERYFQPHLRLLVKIDSTLRGHPAEQIATALAVATAAGRQPLGILAPAFPAMGRTTENGCVCVGGRPLEEHELWRRKEQACASGSLLNMLASAGISGRQVPLATIRRGRDACAHALAAIAQQPPSIAVCDATTQADLECIAACGLALGETAAFIGSAGLARALAATLTKTPTEPIALNSRQVGSLIVIGSTAQASREAVQRMIESRAVFHVPLRAAILFDRSFRAQRVTLVHLIIARLQAGEDVLVDLNAEELPTVEFGPTCLDRLATIMALPVTRAGGLILSGGATASAILSRSGVHGIHLLDEIEPGIPLGLTLGRISMPVITKAGAFGTRESLLRAAERLRLIRLKGSIP